MLAGPFQMTAPTLGAPLAPQWVPAPVPDPFGLPVLDWVERALSQHYGIAHDEVRATLGKLDLDWEDRTGFQYFEQHLNHPAGWSIVAEALLIQVHQDTGADYSAAGPYCVTVH